VGTPRPWQEPGRAVERPGDGLLKAGTVLMPAGKTSSGSTTASLRVWLLDEGGY